MAGKRGDGESLRCSFCNKDQRDVKKLIAGPTVYICDECVDICLDIIAEEREPDEPKAKVSSRHFSKSWKVRSPMYHLKVGASTRTRSSLPWTPPTSCSSAAVLS